MNGEFKSAFYSLDAELFPAMDLHNEPRRVSGPELPRSMRVLRVLAPDYSRHAWRVHGIWVLAGGLSVRAVDIDGSVPLSNLCQLGAPELDFDVPIGAKIAFDLVCYDVVQRIVEITLQGVSSSMREVRHSASSLCGLVSSALADTPKSAEHLAAEVGENVKSVRAALSKLISQGEAACPSRGYYTRSRRLQ